MPDVPRDPDTTDASASTREPEPSKQARRQIGPYRLLQRLGEGGMGEVWLAEQTTPVRRQVALKVIKAGMDTAQVVARFEAERQALALMDHPAIATVFDGGTTPEGRPYFVMEYVKGEPITTYCDRQRLTVAERLELFTRVCEGVQHAHQKGIIHRDLKPSNVLVTIQDEKPVPKIIDFGVAKATAQHLTERTLFTELGVMVGTPEYMSPEQAEMTGVDIDTRTDVYALGVMLYELLTGALPFDRDELRRAGFLEIQRTIREKEPPRPSTRVGPPGPASTEAAKNRHTEPKRLVSDLRGDLDWITMKALEKDRTRRYASASDIAIDIKRHLDDQPVLAGPPSLAYTAKKFVHRNRGPVAAGVLVVLALLAGLVGTSLMYVRSNRGWAEAAWQSYVANLAAADSSLRMNEVAEAKRRLVACDPKLRNWEWRYLSHEVDSGVAALRDAAPGAVRAWFAPDGSHILGLTDRYNLSRGYQPTLLIWDRSGRTPAATRQGHKDLQAATPDGSRVTDATRVFESSSGRVVCLLDWGRAPEIQQVVDHRSFTLPGGRVIRMAEDPGAYQDAVVFSSDGSLLATGEGGARRVISPFIENLASHKGNGTVRVWDAHSGRLRATLVGHRDGVWALAFSPDLTRLVSGSDDRTARVWNLRSRSAVATLSGHTAGVIAVAFSPDGRRVATGSGDRTVRIWDAETGALIQTLTGHTGWVTSVGFSPDGRTVVSGATDKTVCLWDVERGYEIRCLHGHDAGVVSVSFSPKGDQIVSGSVDGSVRVWMPPVSGPLDDIVRRGGVGMACSRNWTVIATNRISGITTWDGASGQKLADIEDRKGGVFSVSMAGDGTRVVVGGRNGVRVWDARSGQQVATFGSPAKFERARDAQSGTNLTVDVEGPSGVVRAVAYRPDSEQISTGGDTDGAISIWDARTFEQIRVLSVKPGLEIYALAYSPDGRLLAGGIGDGTVHVFDDASGRLLHVLRGHSENVDSLAFNSDGSSLASKAHDGTARVWETRSGRQIAVLRGHDHPWLESVSFSPDGSRLVTAARDKTVRVWDARTGDQLLVLRYRKGDPTEAMFTPDGNSIVGFSARESEPRVIWSTK